MLEITVNAGMFKRALSAATRFPILGGIAGSELVTLTVKNNTLRLSTFGTMLSQAKCECVGPDTGLAVDIRLISSFASVCSESDDMTINVDATVTFKCKNREVTAPFTTPVIHKMTAVKDLKYTAKLELTDSIAKQLSFLSALAFSDSSRAELCCVMLTPDHAIACSQKAIAVLTCATASSNTALPLPIARALVKEDTVFVGPTETLLKSGIGTYAIPSPVKAQAEFPVAAIDSMFLSATKPAFSIKGTTLAAGLSEADKCLTAVARTEIVVSLELKNNELSIYGENGGAKYRATIPVANATMDVKLRLPLVEIMSASAFMDAGELTVEIGSKGETILKIGNAWFLFPAWSGK